MTHEAIENPGLRDNILARIGLIFAIVGALLFLTALASPLTIGLVRGIEFICFAYLMVLAAMYQVGVRMFTRGGIITKLESPWSYRFGFAVLSIFGTGPLFVLLGKVVFDGAGTSTWMYLDVSVVFLAGLFFLLGLAIVWGALVIGVIVSIYRFLRSLNSKSNQHPHR